MATAQEKEQAWIEQAKALMNHKSPQWDELPPFAISMLTYFYGPTSVQVKTYTEGVNHISKKDGRRNNLYLQALGAVSNTILELEHGLVGNLRVSIQGELLGDLLNLA